MASVPGDITAVFYTANRISNYFASNIQINLLDALKGIPLISVSHKPMEFGENICVGDIGASHINIYRQAFIGAKEAKTKYIALCEDDVLYSPEHFKHRSSPGKFAYAMGSWSLFTWGKPVFTQKINSRINLNGLICERDLFIETMEERFDKWPEDSKIDLSVWAEPSKYEKYLGVTVREKETFCSNPPNIVFTHQTALSFANLGTRKKMGEIRALEIPIWGSAVDVIKLYR